MKKMAMEGRVCKLHRRDWPSFLTHVVPACVWQALARTIAPTNDPRVRWSLKYVLLAYIGMGWSKQRTLCDRFREARQWLIGLFPRRRRPGETYVGLTEAAKRYGVLLYQQFWACVRGTSKRLGEAWSWHGWHVFAVDGSRDQTTRTQANETLLGQAGRDKSHPQWWMTWLAHLPTLLLWDWRHSSRFGGQVLVILQRKVDRQSDGLLTGHGLPAFTVLHHRSPCYDPSTPHQALRRTRSGFGPASACRSFCAPGKRSPPP